MYSFSKKPQHVATAFQLLRWTVIVIPVAIAIGSAVAVFLWLLDKATALRFANPWLLYLLPVAGVLIWFAYKKYGKNSDKGNNLILEEIHTPGAGVPRRMAPLVLAATVTTHLFGGSAGREGTAVQMGGSIAAMFGNWFGLNKTDRQVILKAGVAAGFGAVFGTPLAGTIFAMEVLTVGRLQYNSLVPCLLAGIVGDAICVAWGIHHTQYHILFAGEASRLFPQYFHIDILLLLKVVMAGIAFGLAGFIFSQLTEFLKHQFKKRITIDWLIPVTGGLIIIAGTFALGTRDYLGLGVTADHVGAVTIVSAFTAGGAGSFSWLWKILFTAVTLSSGFKGGEVTPLFFIGATLGNMLALISGAPVDLFAALGFIAVFAGAANTPLACTVMGVELFGGGHILYFAIACFTAYFFSGQSGIYTSQKVTGAKLQNGFVDHKNRQLSTRAWRQKVINAFKRRHSKTNKKEAGQ